MINIKLEHGATELTRGTAKSTGLDLKARGFALVNDDDEFNETVWFDEAITSVTLAPMERCLIKTGVSYEIVDEEDDDDAGIIIIDTQVRGRSGLSIKKGLFAMQGTIDTDYRNDIGVMLVNLNSKPVTINADDRVGQLVFGVAIIPKEINYVTELGVSDRNGGFGHTGK